MNVAMPVSAFDWTLALPEIVLSVCGLLILVIGVFQRKNASASLCTILAVASFVAPATHSGTSFRRASMGRRTSFRVCVRWDRRGPAARNTRS